VLTAVCYARARIATLLALGLLHAALSGMIALLGLAYFCTVVALAGTDTNATNMALVVLSTLSVCVSLAGTAIVALKFRSTNTRLKCIVSIVPA